MQAPVTFVVSQPTGQPGYVVTVRNKNWFSSTEGLIFSFRLLADGVPVKQSAEEEEWTQFDIAQIPPQVLGLLPLPVIIGVLPFRLKFRLHVISSRYAARHVLTIQTAECYLTSRQLRKLAI